jgi:hypothetical protein
LKLSSMNALPRKKHTKSSILSIRILILTSTI